MASRKKKRTPARSKKASTKRAPATETTPSPELDPAAISPEKAVKGTKSSEYRLWVNPRGPEWKSYTTHVAEGTISFKVDRLTCSGPAGFEVPDEELYEHLLEKTSSTGIPYFLKKKPAER